MFDFLNTIVYFKGIINLQNIFKFKYKCVLFSIFLKLSQNELRYPKNKMIISKVHSIYFFLILTIQGNIL